MRIFSWRRDTINPEDTARSYGRIYVLDDFSKIKGNRAPWDILGPYLTVEPLYSYIQDDSMDIFGCVNFIGGGTQ